MTTIIDVAREAGVSKSTVSMVINNNPKVKIETKYKVLSVIEKLGYVPNISAVELTTKRKHNLGVIRFQKSELKKSFDGDPYTYFQDVANGIYRELQNSNYGMLLEEVVVNSDGTSQVPQIIKTNRVEGVLIIGGIFDKQFIEDIRNKINSFVILGVDYPNVDCVSTDSKFATYSGIKYLIDNGHRDILFINGPEITASTIRKEEGYKLALMEAGIPFKKERYKKSPFSGTGGYNAAKEALEVHPLPTAVFTGSDSISSGVLRYLYERRLVVPEDISIATFDDSILTEFGTPPLTSVNINKELIGIEGYKVLLNRIGNPNSERKCIHVPNRIIDRGSVKKI